MAAIRGCGPPAGLADHLLAPDTPGVDRRTTLSRRRSIPRTRGNLARAWALAGGDQSLAELRPDIKFYEEVRVWMGKIGANRRRAEGKPIPGDIRRLLSRLVADSTASGEIVDIYEGRRPAQTVAERPHPRLRGQGAVGGQSAPRDRGVARHPHRRITPRHPQQPGAAARILRPHHRTDAPVHQSTDHLRRGDRRKLIAMAHDIAAEGNRGQSFNPPLSDDGLAFFDAVAANRSAVELREQRRPGRHRPRTGPNHAARTPNTTGPSATTSRQTSLIGQTGARQVQSTRRTNSPRPSGSSSSRWRHWPRVCGESHAGRSS